jgi:transaldolase
VGVDVVKPAVFLDRDGVINRAIVRSNKPFPPMSVAEVEVLPGVPEALARLRAAGYALVVVTNQPDIARGKQTREGVQAIHDYLATLIDVDEFRVCFHDDADGCSCRKPKPGLLTAAPAHALERSIVVGDRWRDIEAGRRAGCRAAVFIDYEYDDPRPVDADTHVRSLAEAADWILKLENESWNPATLRTKIFADGAELEDMLALYRQPYIKGFTTNPTLMRKAGITDYRAFARQVVTTIPDRPISFEVFADDFSEMERQALEIATWGEHVYVKIPVTNTKRETAKALIHRLSHRGVKLNVTAIMTLDQVREVADALAGGVASYVSVFAGRIADTGRDPVPLMMEAVRILESEPRTELMWAGPRELLNIFQANAIGCHIITLTHDILKKLSLIGKDLDDYSLETVKMFHDDAEAAGFSLEPASRP